MERMRLRCISPRSLSRGVAAQPGRACAVVVSFLGVTQKVHGDDVEHDSPVRLATQKKLGCMCAAEVLRLLGSYCCHVRF
mmetsp:Transcript_4548/g.9959  ORF Transcript_4548/g.9959 Transcript_4548/m.9959 type:complete len:80 (-) Transcript_4548:132-371(-)